MVNGSETGERSVRFDRERIFAKQRHNKTIAICAPRMSSPQLPLQPTQSMQDGTRAVWCLVEGDSSPFKVTVAVTADIGDLKKLVREEGKNASLRGIDAKDLTLWMVRHKAAGEVND